jgi:hypothetical protein
MELGHLLTRSGLTYSEVSSKVCHDSFCQLKKCFIYSPIGKRNHGRPLKRLNVTILPLDLPCSGPVTHSGEILTTDNSHGKKLDRFSLNDDTDVKKVSRFKYATWNIRRLEELDKILNENNIKISVITKKKKELQGTKETEHYTIIYSGLDRHIRGQSGVMIRIHKSTSNKIDHY